MIAQIKCHSFVKISTDLASEAFAVRRRVLEYIKPWQPEFYEGDSKQWEQSRPTPDDKCFYFGATLL